MSDGSMDDDGRLFPDLGSSTHDNREIRVRFLNRCAYPVDVFWLNPSKQPTKYGTLAQKKYLDIKTFKDHPWVARRSFDGCKVLVNEKEVFWPEPAPRMNLIVRNHCVITMKVQSLREIAGRSFLRHNPTEVPNKIKGLPRELQFEVKHFLDRKQEYSEIVCRSIPPPGPQRPQQ
ncbi:von Hippel-Lindau tumor suppressor homolog [Caenorhabditis elegans]|uniref:von Hippel-Lindau tumor suppressor homolog n=1 Tax=Caenorhabditis elegans TaxID=6239 RepID=VHL_CAEEL|nr:von Hippel-Lindau tumor suppressor homolog [Caenorhabditis elegans]Q19213.1 RecName: Full=von Hippel-Lindau tumor suppressor homolog [Caenorhabditis elegans]CAA91456.1 von Hippel-Lindau tumor suppressor homolog [Caenorhabditis elegans]|eukprot:NP_509889.1 von Hippel-Lindau tumor suppressor homolog [Caenorhabditis elegans]